MYNFDHLQNPKMLLTDKPGLQDKPCSTDTHFNIPCAELLGEKTEYQPHFLVECLSDREAFSVHEVAWKSALAGNEWPQFARAIHICSDRAELHNLRICPPWHVQPFRLFDTIYLNNAILSAENISDDSRSDRGPKRRSALAGVVHGAQHSIECGGE